MTQNEAFLPYTINPGLTTSAMPRTSLNGLVRTTFLSARLSMRPVRNLSVNASLRHENRDNKTPQSEYIYIGGDIQLQPQPASNSDRIRTNLPRSRRQEQMTLDADYRVSATTAIKAGWDRDDVTRTFAEVERATEDTYRVELRQGGTGPWTANASYARLVRRGTQYLYNLPYLASYTSPAFIGGLAAANGCAEPISCIRNGPLQNKFYLADRDRELSRLIIGFTPNAPVSLRARLDVNRDGYPNSSYGVTDASGWSASADLGYALNDDFSATLFYTYEDQRSRERSRQIQSADPAAASSPDSDWVNQLADKASSAGFGMKYKGLLGGRLELDVDAIAVRGRTPISTTVGPAVPAAQNPAAPLPDLTMRSADFNLAARYAVDRHSTVRLNYAYRRLNSADWAYQQVGAATLANVIGTNEIPARYSVHGAGISYVRSFR
jgi:MtrB/PioB family decaheme-associated outer membrane protein